MKEKCISPTVLTSATIQEEELQGCRTEMIRTWELEIKWAEEKAHQTLQGLPVFLVQNMLPFVFSQIICSVPVVGIVYKTKLYCH